MRKPYLNIFTFHIKQLLRNDAKTRVAVLTLHQDKSFEIGSYKL
jgi:hypothetical protein